MILLDPPFLGEDVKSGLPVLILAVDIAGSSCVFLTNDMEGRLQLLKPDEVLSDFRYDMKAGKWYDASVGLKEDG